MTLPTGGFLYWYSAFALDHEELRRPDCPEIVRAVAFISFGSSRHEPQNAPEILDGSLTFSGPIGIELEVLEHRSDFQDELARS